MLFGTRIFNKTRCQISLSVKYIHVCKIYEFPLMILFNDDFMNNKVIPYHYFYHFSPLRYKFGMLLSRSAVSIIDGEETSVTTVL